MWSIQKGVGYREQRKQEPMGDGALLIFDEAKVACQLMRSFRNNTSMELAMTPKDLASLSLYDISNKKRNGKIGPEISW